MSNDNLPKLYRQLVLAEESEAAEIVELADPERDAHIVAALLKTLPPEQSKQPEREADAAAMSPPKPERPASVGVMPGLWSRVRPQQALLFVAMAILVAVLIPKRLFIGHPSRVLHNLPAYAMTIPGDDRAAGAEPRTNCRSGVGSCEAMSSPGGEQIPKLSLDSFLLVELRPDTSIQDEVETRAFLKHEGTLSAWPVSLQRYPEGTLRLRGRVRDMPLLSPGRWELIFAIGHPEQLPAQEDLYRRLNSGARAADNGWQLVHGLVDITLPIAGSGDRPQDHGG